jgi:hypothetical protein
MKASKMVLGVALGVAKLCDSAYKSLYGSVHDLHTQSLGF